MLLSGWGRYPRITSFARSVERAEELPGLLAEGSVAVRALGRGYGDCALGPRALLTRRLSRIHDFDPASGIVSCEAGVGLHELIDVFLPRGWFPAVTPGTKYVSVGGAIAADVHGKNHHVRGCFSQCVESFDLALPDGSVKRCSPTENAELFRATCGGMGLTGLILSARVRLAPAPSAFIEQRTLKSRDLRETFELFEASGQATYSVAWIDCLARGRDLGRCLLMLGEHAESAPRRQPRGLPLNMPVELPGFVLNKHSVRLFNHLYYNRVRGRETRSLVGVDGFFYPLDAIGHWYRLYGRKGFTQYQFVLPKDASFEGLAAVLERIARAGQGSFLAVLKLFGPENDNPLSFPREGYTLALDFAIEPRLFPLLDELDRVVLDHGGRFYLAKDARMTRETFEAGYPRVGAFRALRKGLGLDRSFATLQSQRLEL